MATVPTTHLADARELLARALGLIDELLSTGDREDPESSGLPLPADVEGFHPHPRDGGAS
jgi:hypothetical protein